MYYNYSYDYQDIYSLDVGESPSLNFTYFDEFDTYKEYPITGMSTTMTYNNLDTSTAGYYYRTYHATYSTYYDLTFRIVFQVGNPQPYDTVPQEHMHYNYSTDWEDQLVSFGEIDYINGVAQTEATIQEYTYDNQGNPTYITNFVYNGTTYYGANLSWSGRELTNIYVMSSSQYPIYQIEYTYNDQGYRIEKEISTFNGSGFTINQTIKYELIDDKVVYETDGDYGIMFTYDYDGTLISFDYDSDVTDQTNGSEYFYIRNQMGDITHIANSNGIVVVHYVYDAYGNIVETEISSGYTAIANANPYRYRGYRYDTETNLYYLNSRYYDSNIGRFINADGLLGGIGDVQSTNMYTYCANNPVNRSDESGYFWNIIAGAAIGFVIGFGVNLAIQAISGDELDISKALVAGAAGAISGALTATGLGAGAVAIGNGLVSSAETAATTLLNGDKITGLELGISFIVGAGTSLLTGGGVKNSKSYLGANAQYSKWVSKSSKVLGSKGAYKTMQGLKSAFTQAKNRYLKEQCKAFTKFVITQTGIEIFQELVID
ncbi:MAG: RHS repeat-associated core domain-containing protein [Tenericutes bacterium]|nr:RHS repeat-associated core domain-containing protein [Mycoplasmatota bacterium]